MKKYTIIILCFIVFNISGYSQNLDEFNIPRYNTDRILPQAPNAAAFNRYGQYPVDLSSGLVKIDIPLYTIKTKQLEVPISLSYHSSGIKVNDIPSSVGLGWSLMAGGMVGVQVKGKPDTTSPDGDFPTAEELNKLTNQELADLQILEDMAFGNYDLVSDLYSYSAPGLNSGHFMYNYRDNSVIQIPESDNKIIYLNSGFLITSENGTKYYFNGGGSSVQTVEGIQSNSTCLSRIESADSKDFIEFEYEVNTSYEDNPPSFSASIGSEIMFYPTGGPYGVSNWNIYSGLEISYANTRIRYSETILTKIKFNGGEVIFKTANDRKDRVQTRYTGMEVKSPINDSLVFSCDFIHDYFESESYNGKEAKEKYPTFFYRLSLSGLRINSNISDDKSQNYHFFYNTTPLPPYDYSYYYFVKEPWFFRYPMDLWGYYNGEANHHTLIPHRDDTEYEFNKITKIGYTQYGLPNRNISEEYAKACSLEKIIYPSGGGTVFCYESNKTIYTQIGGLRIKEVNSYNEDEELVETKTYEYIGGQEIGLTSQTDYYSSYLQKYDYRQIFMGSISYTSSKRIYSTNPFLYRAISNSPIYYSHVIEYFGDQYNNYGKKEYQFRYNGNEVDFNPGYGASNPRYKTSFIDNHWKRGQLLTEKTYKKSQNGYELLQSITNNYKTYKEKKEIAGTIVTCSQIPLKDPDRTPRNAYRWFDEVISTGVVKLISTKTENYIDGNLAQVEEIKYDYAKLMSTTNNHLQLTSKSIKTSTQDSIITKLIYPQDIELNSQTGNDVNVIKQFKEKNILNQPIEILQYVKKEASSPLVTNGIFYKFNGINQLDKKLCINTKQPFQYDGVSFVNSQGYNYSDKYEPEISYKYDAKNNIIEYKDKADISTSIIWSYNNLYPIVEGKNITYEKLTQSINNIGLNVPTLNNSINPNFDKLKELHKNLPDNHITLYKYKPLIGIQETIDPTGISTYYSYDGFSRLSNIKDNNESLLNSYSYNYKEPDLFINCSFLVKSQYTQYSTIDFNISSYNTSDGYTYMWELRDESNNALLSGIPTSIPKCSFLLWKEGKMSMTCIVRNSKGESKSFKRKFNVVAPSPFTIGELTPTKEYFEFSEDVLFKVNPSGGSGQYYTTWNIIDLTSNKWVFYMIEEQFFMNQLLFTLPKAGEMKVVLTARDRYTNEKITLEKRFTVGSPPAFESRITPNEPEYGDYQTETFKALTKGGSGKFLYNWEWKDMETGSIYQRSKDSSFNITFSKKGPMQVICEVRDSCAVDTVPAQRHILDINVVDGEPMIVKILPEKYEYEINQSQNFILDIINGSGQYEYNWKLIQKSTGDIVKQDIGSSLYVQFNNLGEYEISCKVIDTWRGITKETKFSFSVISVPIEFYDIKYTTPQSDMREVEGYIYVDKPTTIKLNLWINGRFTNDQYAYYWIGHTQQYKRDNTCDFDKEGNKPCMNSDETITLPKGETKFRVVLYDLDNNVTRAGIIIKSVENGNLGVQSYLNTGND